MTQDAADIIAGVRAQIPHPLPERLGVAVSGGSDSVALLHILHRALTPEGVQLYAVTVDHGLRAASAAEAEDVAALATGLGLSHDILHWAEGPGAGNLQDQARQARYGLLRDWARRKGIAALALGHTADDQAETVLMRLTRASGVDGLSAMSAVRQLEDLTLLRPLLSLRRADLRDYLRAEGVPWVDDPSNEDRRFDRVRLRQALPMLEELGLSVEALSLVAKNMQQARQTLDHYALSAAQEGFSFQAGAVAVERAYFAGLPDEIAHRLLRAALQWVSGGTYPPRRAPMMAALETARTGGSATLAGGRILCRRGRVWICREAQALRGQIAEIGQVWDGKWEISCLKSDGCKVRALGAEGLQLCPDWRETGLPGPVLEVTPALWRGADLIAAPLVRPAPGCTAELTCSEEEFFASFLSH